VIDERLTVRDVAALSPRGSRESDEAAELMALQGRLSTLIREIQTGNVAHLIAETDAIALLDDALSHITWLTEAAVERADNIEHCTRRIA
jgi:hypothetical protein